MPAVRIYENPGGEAMAEGQVDWGNALTYNNPRRGSRNPADNITMTNPNMVWEQLANGSPVTQDISVADGLVGAVSFLVHDWAAKITGLRGWAGVVVSGILPFVTGAGAGMVHGRFGSVVFLSGEIVAILKAIGMVTPVGFSDASGDLVLKGLPSSDLSNRLGLAGASQMNGLQEYTPARVPLAVGRKVQV